MNEFEKVILCFKKSRAHEIMPACYNPSAFLNVYDKENDYKPAVITNIFKDSNGDIGIEIRYTDDDTIRCYKLYEDTDTDLPICDTHPEYRYDGSESFHYLFITEDTVSKYKNKVWPELFDGGDGLYLEYIETIDPSHANYKFFWPDGFGRESEYLVTLSRDDINELLNNPVSFIYELQETIEIIGLWKKPNDDDEEDD